MLGLGSPSYAVTLNELPKMQLHTGDIGPLYADAIRDSQLIISGNPANFTSADIDNDGWLIRLPDTGDKAFYKLSEADVLHGVYVVTWEGTGTVEFKCPQNAEIILLNDPVNRRLVARNPQGSAVRIVVSNLDSNDYVRNIRCWRPATVGAGSNLTSSSNLTVGNVEGSLEPATGTMPLQFHPERLQMLSAGDPKVLRFMGWLTNISSKAESRTFNVAWSERTPQNYALQSGKQFISYEGIRTNLTEFGFKSTLGMSYEDIIDLCNELGVDPWLQIPYDSSSTFIENFAELVADNLDPALRVWFELSNEFWNSAPSYLPQNTSARQRYADAFNVNIATVDKNGSKAGWGAGDYVGSALKTFKDQWAAKGEASDRVIGVAAGWLNGVSFNQAVYNRAEEISAGCVDVFAITSYFANHVADDLVNLEYDTEGNATEATFMEAAFIAEAAIYGGLKRNLQKMVDVLPVPIVAYEGGQHLTPIGYIRGNPGFHEFLANFNRHPLMAELYLTHWHLWKSFGFGTPSLFTELKTWGTSGYWGAKESVYDDRVTHPKWGAYLDFTADQANTRHLGFPINEAPSITTTEFSVLEQNSEGVATVEAAGGDGNLTLEHVGGFLPEGLSFTDNGDGTAEFSGIPLSWGTYFVTVRVKDQDGDPAYANFTMEVDLAGVGTNNLIQFLGTDVDAKYNTQRVLTAVDGGLRKFYPFSIADGDEFFGEAWQDSTKNLDPLTTDLNFYGGYETVYSEIAGLTNTNDPVPSPLLQEGVGLQSWHGGTQNLVSEDNALFVWRKDQFNNFPGETIRFGEELTESTLLLDTLGVGSNETEIHFVIKSGSTWYFSEAAYTDTVDGTFSLEGFNNNAAVGFRWAEFTPTANNFALPVNPVFNAVSFTDVQAVGFHAYGRQDRYGWTFGFARFLALGKGENSSSSQQSLVFDFMGSSPGLNAPWTQTASVANMVLTTGFSYGTTHTGNGGIQGKDGANEFRFGLWNPNKIDGDKSTRSTLADAISADNYVTFTVSANAGEVLDLDGGMLNFIYNRHSTHAANDLAVFTSAGGFTQGDAVATFDDQTGSLNIPLTGADYNGLSHMEVRVYLYDASFNANHQCSFTGASLTNGQ